MPASSRRWRTWPHRETGRHCGIGAPFSVLGLARTRDDGYIGHTSRPYCSFAIIGLSFMKAKSFCSIS